MEVLSYDDICNAEVLRITQSWPIKHKKLQKSLTISNRPHPHPQAPGCCKQYKRLAPGAHGSPLCFTLSQGYRISLMFSPAPVPISTED